MRVETFDFNTVEEPTPALSLFSTDTQEYLNEKILP